SPSATSHALLPVTRAARLFGYMKSGACSTFKYTTCEPARRAARMSLLMLAMASCKEVTFAPSFTAIAPRGEQKSFCTSITSSVVLAGSMGGVGYATRIILLIDGVLLSTVPDTTFAGPRSPAALSYSRGARCGLHGECRL